jgi:hypothetical protein
LLAVRPAGIAALGLWGHELRKAGEQMLEKPIVFSRLHGEISVMLRADAAESMLEKMKSAGWSGTIEWYQTAFSHNGGEPEVPAVIKLRDVRFIDGVQFVNSKN